MGNRKRRKTDENERLLERSIIIREVVSSPFQCDLDFRGRNVVQQSGPAGFDTTVRIKHSIMSKITFLMYNSVGPLCARTNYPRQAGKQARIVICRARERMGGPRAGG